ncbi:Subtilase family protein [Euphorbia peplus]|nr:Subtilase family protein [Euphorbia peplus]
MSKITLILLVIAIILQLTQSAFAVTKSYTVYLGSHSHARDPDQVEVEVDLHAVTHSHYQVLGSVLGSADKAKDAIIYSYNKHINGFSALLEDHEAAEIARHPRVVSVLLNKGKQLHTTHSWEFMLLGKNGVVHPQSLWYQAKFGRDVIIANLDSGVWPESKSFSDEGFGPIPSKWKGTCQNNSTSPFSCNKKLIGARYYNKGYINAEGELDPVFNSPRDYEGHGTHTLSTAAGNSVQGANIFGVANGTATGGSPGARVATYKVCWPPVHDGGCYDDDILSGFEDAIQDGVDVISFSVGGPPADYFEDPIAIGAFHAVKNNIVVVCSAGNEGPTNGSVTNVAPWVITVGASTLDRTFQSVVATGDGRRFNGKSLSKPMPRRRLYPLVTGLQAKAANASARDAELCMPESLDYEKVKGKILVCLRGAGERVAKGYQAILAGAEGMILCNDELNGNAIAADPHVLPSSHITYRDGLALLSYINSSPNPVGYINPPTTEIGKIRAPLMAPFSSVGPNTVTPEIIKPDITAPGVDIIASFTQERSPTGLTFDKRRVPFKSMSGTSMSCPHIAGIVGLLKSVHPDWSPAAIRSAITTTARTRDNTGAPIVDGWGNEATPFHYGSGHVRPNRAMNPGLVYDLTTNDYLDFLCALGYNQSMINVFSSGYECSISDGNLDSFNYPSISVPELSGTVTVSRRLKNVGPPGRYVVMIKEPYGVSVEVEPRVLRFDEVGEEKMFKVKIEAKWGTAAQDGYEYGGITWTDGFHYVRSPIVVKSSGPDYHD